METKAHIEIVNSRAFARAVADEISASITDVLEDKEFCTIALAGGSTPGSIYRVLARPPHSTDIDWSRLKLFWGDERWVEADDQNSNYKMVCETLLDQVNVPDDNIFKVETGMETPEKGAEDYKNKILKEVPHNDAGVPEFDLMILGCGKDGHTASLFPGDSEILNSSGICKVAKHPEDKKERVTLMPEVIKAARQIIFIATGTAKADIVKTVLTGEFLPEKYPAQIYREVAERVSWFIDSSAATKISHV